MPRRTRANGWVPLAWFVCLVLPAVMPTVAHTQASAVRVVVTSPPSPVGAGARAVGMGSAFVAVADDATAASWNPAGLVQLERPEVSAVALATYEVDTHGVLIRNRGEDGIETIPSATDESFDLGLNYLSAAMPFTWKGRNVLVSLNYQQMLSFDRAFRFERTQQVPEQAALIDQVDFEQAGRVDAFSPALALDLMPGLSIGATFNYWFDGLGRAFAWRAIANETLVREGEPAAVPETFVTRETFQAFHGVNATFGLLWSPDWGLSVAAVAELPFHSRFTLVRSAGSADRPEFQGRERLAMQLPGSYALGVSYRPIDEVVLSADVTWVDWGDFWISDAAGREFLVSAERADQAHVDAVTTVRAGAEWSVLLRQTILTMRAGAFYDPEPSRGTPQDFYGLSLGLGVTRQQLSVDLAYQLRFGLGVRGVAELSQLFLSPDGELDVVQHAVYLSTVWYF